MEPRQRASPEQFSILLEFMESHGDLARPQLGPQGRLRSEQLWRDLTTLLNSVGGGVQKSLDKWKKVWADWKTKTKKKFLCIRLRASATGGGEGPSSSKQLLTALEERVIAVIGLSAVTGISGIEEQGFNRILSEEPAVEGEGSGLQLYLEIPHSQSSVGIPSLTTVSPAALNLSPPPAALNLNPPPAALNISPPPAALNLSSAPAAMNVSPPPASRVSVAAPPPPLPPTPRGVRRPRQASASPSLSTPRRSLLRARRNRGLTPFERAASEFAVIERRRLELEETRDRRHQELHMEILRLESIRAEIAQNQNQQILNLLHQISQRLLDALTQQR